MKLLVLAALVAYTPGYPDLPRKVGDVRGSVTGATALPGPTVQLRVAHIQPIGEDDAAWRSQLVVLAAGGKVVWAGPKGPQHAPLVYQGGPAGEDRLEAAGDGQVIVQLAQSDLRIPTHQFLRWTGRGFQVAREAMFVEQPPKSGRFVPTTNSEPRGRWIASFKRIAGPGRCEVVLGDDKPAVVQATKDGYQLVP